MSHTKNIYSSLSYRELFYVFLLYDQYSMSDTAHLTLTPERSVGPVGEKNI